MEFVKILMLWSYLDNVLVLSMADRDGTESFLRRGQEILLKRRRHATAANQSLDRTVASDLDRALAKKGRGFHFFPVSGNDAIAPEPVAEDDVAPIFPPPDKKMRMKPPEFVLPDGAAETMQQLAQLVLGVTHESNAPMVLRSGSESAMVSYTAAQEILKKVANADKFTAYDIADLVELVSESQSAESAAANGALITASQFSEFLNGFRGEDYGANYNFDTTNMAKQTYQGDIMKEMSTKPWKDGRVKYCFAPDVSTRVKHIFKKAAKQYTRAVPFLTFEDVGHKSGNSDSIREYQRCQSTPAIFVTSSDDYGCFAHRGMMDKGSQSLQLNDPGCILIGTVVHMLGHALGAGHEHFARSTAVSSNHIKHRRSSNFQFSDEASASQNSLSIMHFDPYAFADDPLTPTLEGPSFHQMGQRVALAKSDADRIVALYASEGCKESAFDGLGCVNDPDMNCPPLSQRMPWCSADSFKGCCGCGGGTTVQCFKDSTGTDKKCPRIQSVAYMSVLRVVIVVALILAPLLVWLLALLFSKKRPSPAGEAKVDDQVGPSVFHIGEKIADYHIGSPEQVCSTRPEPALAAACYGTFDKKGDQRLAQEHDPKPAVQDQDLQGTSHQAAGSNTLVPADQASVSEDAKKGRLPSLPPTVGEGEDLKKTMLAPLPPNTKLPPNSSSGAITAVVGEGEDMKKTMLAPLPPNTKTNQPSITTSGGVLAALGEGIGESLLEKTERAPPSRLSMEAMERFKGDFAPLAGGFSCGRSAPPAELVSRINNVGRGFDPLPPRRDSTEQVQEHKNSVQQ